MSRTSIGRALVATTTLLLGHLALAPAAEAAGGTCGTGTPYVGTASGDTGYYGRDWWQTTATGPTSFFVESPNYSEVHVYDATCSTRLCSSSAAGRHQCTATVQGTVHVMVTGYYAQYTLTSAPGVAGVTPFPASGPCNVLDTVAACVNVTTGTEVQRVSVYDVQSSTAYRVVGAVDSYRFPLPTGGSVVLPCVVLTANSTGSSGCSAAGGTFVARVATLVDQTVARPWVGGALASVGVCESSVTVTSLGFGVEEFPALTVC